MHIQVVTSSDSESEEEGEEPPSYRTGSQVYLMAVVKGIEIPVANAQIVDDEPETSDLDVPEEFKKSGYSHAHTNTNTHKYIHVHTDGTRR